MPKRQTIAAPPAPTQPDVFFDVFSTLRLRGEWIGQTSPSRHQPREFPSATAYFHYVEHAPCTLRIAGRRRPLTLQPGDLLLLPQGHAHRIEAATTPGRTPYGLTSGRFRVEGVGGDLLSRALPPLLHVPQLDRPPAAPPDTAAQWLQVTLNAIRLEADRPSVGSALMLSRLIDLLFVWAVRHWLATAPDTARGWIAALRDPLIARALTLLHERPAEPWTVEALAERLHQSRSGLSQRFVDRVGEPPIRYLTRWRMQLAAEWLRSSSLRISQIAQRVGYDSEPAFSRAFRRRMGVTPMEFRNGGVSD